MLRAEVETAVNTNVAKKSGGAGVKEDQNRADVLVIDVGKVADKSTEEQRAGTQLTLDEAREKVAGKVRDAAGEIADGLIKEAKAGELAPAKFLFEVTGLYPAIKETRAGGSSLAEMLLKRMGIPSKEPGEGAGLQPPVVADPEIARNGSGG